MRIEEQIRNLANDMEATQMPVSAEMIIHGSTEHRLQTGEPGRTRSGAPAMSAPHRWLAVAASVLIAGGVVALIALNARDGDPVQPVNSVDVTAPTRTDATTITPTTDVTSTTSTTIGTGSGVEETQRTDTDPIGPPIEPNLAGTAVGSTSSLEWDGILDSTSLDPGPGPHTYVTTTPGGAYLMMDFIADWSEDDGRLLDRGGPKFWRSIDGVSWSPATTLELQLPDESDPLYGGYRRIGDEHWIVGFAPPTLWRSTDTVEWTSVEVPEPPPRTPVVGRALALYDAGGRALWIGASGTGYWFSDDTGEWVADPEVVDPYDSTPAADSRTGEWWESLPAARGDTVVIGGSENLSVSTPDGTARVPAPWTAEAAFVEAVGDTFVAYVGSVSTKDYWFEFHSRRELMLDAIWISDDGVDWTGPIAPEFIDGPTPALFLTNNGVTAVVTQRGLWTSRDGVTWTDRNTQPVLNDGTVATVGDGALLNSGGRAWFSLDMETWNEIPLSWSDFGLPPGFISQSEYALSAGDFLYLLGAETGAWPPPIPTDLRIIPWP